MPESRFVAHVLSWIVSGLFVAEGGYDKGPRSPLFSIIS